MYNLSAIMKRAWELKKSYFGKITFSACLKNAWREAKLEAGKAAIPTEFTDGMEVEIEGVTRTFKLWTNYGKARIYINNPEASNKNRSDGYVDLQTRKAVLNGGYAFQTWFAEAILNMTNLKQYAQ